VVSFAAMDLALVAGMPASRRAYLDGATAKLVPAHGEACRRYRLVLRQRAQLLGRLAAGRGDGSQALIPWDEQVAAIGSEIVHRRLDTLARLRQEARDVLARLGPGVRDLDLIYRPGVPVGVDGDATRVALLTALTIGRSREIRRGMTLVGPHRDDVAVHLGGVDARLAASRGEQRLLALCLRLAEAGVLRRRLGQTPVFLLDDLLSDLDAGVRERVLTWLAGQGQVLFTTTDAVPDAAAQGVAWQVRHAGVTMYEPVAARGAA
jgi:DNA replication and repair protein RecF